MAKEKQPSSYLQKQHTWPRTEVHDQSYSEYAQKQPLSEKKRLSVKPLPRLDENKAEQKKGRSQSLNRVTMEKQISNGPKRIQSVLVSPLMEKVDISGYTSKKIMSRKRKPRKQKLRYKDLPFFLLFLFTWLAIIGISYYGFKFGNLSKIVLPVDSFGNQCGKNIIVNNENLSSMNALAIFDLNNTTSYRRCVSICPGQIQAKTICRYGITPQNDPALLTLQLDQKICISPSETIPVFHRCVPKDLETMTMGLQKLKIMDTLTEDINRLPFPQVHIFFNLLNYMWSAIASTIGLSILLTLFWFHFVQKAGFVLIIVTLMLIGGIILSITVFFGYNYFQLVLLKNSYGSIGLDLIDSSLYNILHFGIAAIIGAVIFLVYIGIIFFYRKRIAFAGKIIHETGNALVYIGIVPILGASNALCISFVLIYSIIIAGELVSSIDETIFYRSSTTVYIMLCYLLFWFFWTTAVTFLVGRIAVADTVSAWYWRKQKERKISFLASLNTVLKVHFGSITFGTLIIPLVNILRPIEYYFRPNYQKVERKESIGPTSCFDRSNIYMRWVIDSIKHKAFIEMVQSGRNFCESAEISEKKAKENMSVIMIITTTGAIISWMAVFLVIGSTLFIELLYVEQYLAFSLQSTIMLFACLIAFAFLIAYGFLGNFQTVLETIIYCYIEDLDKNDGSSFKPYAMSTSLQKLMGLIPS